MRVLMLAQFYPPIIGGEEHQVRHLSRALAERGHEVAVATFEQADSANFASDGMVRVYRIGSTLGRSSWFYREPERRHAAPIPDPETMSCLGHVLERERPQIVHAHNWLVHSFLPLKKRSGAKLVLTLHDYSLVCVKKRLMYEGRLCAGPGFAKCLGCAGQHYGVAKGTAIVLGNWLMSGWERSAVDMFLPVSQAVAAGNGLVESGLPFQVMPNFLPDTMETDPAPVDAFLRQLPPDGFMLFVGDLGFDKGSDVLLRAYAELGNVPPLVLIGRSPAGPSRSYPANVHILKSWPTGPSWRHGAGVPSHWSRRSGRSPLVWC